MANVIPKEAGFSGAPVAVVEAVGAIYPFLDDLNEVLHPHFAGTKYEQLFVGNFVDRVHSFDLSEWSTQDTWNPAKITTASEDYRIYCTLGYQMKLVEEILTRTITNEVRYHLHMFMDTHIPLMIHMQDHGCTNEYLLTDYGGGAPVVMHGPSMDHVFHEGKIPNVLNYIVDCSFWSDTRSKVNPIIHILSKGLPQRCQIRNMREILNKYSRKHDIVYKFIYSCLMCSLLGMYQSCEVRPNLFKRIRIYKKFNNISKAEMLQWMLAEHQQLLFYVIKEFLIFGVRDIPSIYLEIERRYHWDKFEGCVKQAMNTVRTKIQDSDQMMHFYGIEHELIAINKQQVHHLFRPTRQMFCTVVVSECDRLDDINCLTDVRTVFPQEYKDIMYRMSIRTKLTEYTTFEWLKYFNIEKDIIEKLMQLQETYNVDGTKGSLKNFLSTLKRYDFECIRDLCEVFDRKSNVRLFTLPKHIYIKQCQALRYKHRIPNGESLPEGCGSSYVCLECKQFKGFISRFEKGKAVNLFAYGHSKVLIDDETMELYCGKRCDKIEGKKRHVVDKNSTSFIDVDYQQLVTATEMRNRKRHAKEVRKRKHHVVCSKTPLVPVNLLGVALQFYGNIYTVCPCCGNFQKVTGEHFTKDGFYCGACLNDGKLFAAVSCDWCKAEKGNDSWTPIKVIENGEEKKINLCGSCHKPWIRGAGTILEWNTIKRGLEERWKRLNHPAM